MANQKQNGMEWNGCQLIIKSAIANLYFTPINRCLMFHYYFRPSFIIFSFSFVCSERMYCRFFEIKFTYTVFWIMKCKLYSYSIKYFFFFGVLGRKKIMYQRPLKTIKKLILEKFKVVWYNCCPFRTSGRLYRFWRYCLKVWKYLEYWNTHSGINLNSLEIVIKIRIDVPCFGNICHLMIAIYFSLNYVQSSFCY